VEKLRQKQPRLALASKGCDRLKMLILERDGWKCQACGSSTNLQVHHLVYRSQLGAAPDNLITLCVHCHGRAHKEFKRPLSLRSKSNHPWHLPTVVRTAFRRSFQAVCAWQHKLPRVSFAPPNSCSPSVLSVCSESRTDCVEEFDGWMPRHTK
jgi:hypothetical protein